MLWLGWHEIPDDGDIYGIKDLVIKADTKWFTGW